ncbi:protein SMALL AUXIN UP-REGULATED RNA 51-like [Argentina anserina]|uniref:protein SMALL AUXIN UP-REGULATED RNA 51-like n=1 Tax=Argentina anserina TaxID=57926 RepID=UPI0021761F84|nr:protein SMALL AUXIN UP-REGULATED RNA 51-like [Potentilla anserina]
MAKSRSTSGKKKNNILKLKVLVEKLQTSLSLIRKSNLSFQNDSTSVPEDVKEGHFAVIAADGENPKRFVVPLSYLAHPTFLKLLEQAAEEFGFDHEGALAIPCLPSELEKMLRDEHAHPHIMEKDSSSSSSGVYWSSCKALVQSY